MHNTPLLRHRSCGVCSTVIIVSSLGSVLGYQRRQLPSQLSFGSIDSIRKVVFTEPRRANKVQPLGMSIWR